MFITINFSSLTRARRGERHSPKSWTKYRDKSRTSARNKNLNRDATFGRQVLGEIHWRLHLSRWGRVISSTAKVVNAKSRQSLRNFPPQIIIHLSRGSTRPRVDGFDDSALFQVQVQGENIMCRLSSRFAFVNALLSVVDSCQLIWVSSETSLGEKCNNEVECRAY